jgi:hypothetical protein
VKRYRADLDRDAAYQAAIDKHTSHGERVITNRAELPRVARSLRDLGFDTSQARAHHREPCHVVVIASGSWQTTPQVTPTCTEPARHRPNRRHDRSTLVIEHARDEASRNRGADNGAARRKSRVARLQAGRDAFTTGRGPATATLTAFAFHTLIDQAGPETRKYAATLLGIDNPDQANWTVLVGDADSTAKLARLAGAVACGIAETRAYYSSTAPTVRTWFELLAAHGWTPDDWTTRALSSGDDDQSHATDDDAPTDDNVDDAAVGEDA